MCVGGYVSREGDVQRAARFAAAAAEGAGVTAPLSEPLLAAPAYGPLLHHDGFEMVATAQASSSSAFIFVGGWLLHTHAYQPAEQ